MNKKLKWFLFGSAFLVIGLIFLLIILYSYTPTIDKAIITLINSLNDQEFKVSYLKISGSLLNRVKIEDLLITSGKDTISCKKIEFDYSLFELAKREFYFNDVAILQPRVILHSGARPDITPNERDSFRFSLPFDKFPDLKFKKLALDNGSLIIRNGKTTNKFIDLQLTLFGELNADSLNLSVNNFGGQWENRELILNDLSLQLKGNPSKLVIDKFRVSDKHVAILAGAEYQFLPKTQISLNIDSLYVNLDLVNLFIPNFPYKKGFTSISGSFAGVPENFYGDADISGKFDSLKINRFRTRVHKKANSLQLSDIHLASNFGNLTGSLLAAPEGKNNAKLTIANVNLKKIGVMNKETSISGDIDFNFDNWNLRKLSGNGKIILPSLKIATVQFDSVQLNVKAINGNFELEHPSKIKLSRDSEFSLAGKFSKDEFMNIQLTTSNNHLDTLFDRIGMSSFRGRGDLDLQLDGFLDNPDLMGFIKLDSLMYEHVKIYDVTGHIDIKRTLRNRSGNFSLDISSGKINTLNLTKGSLRFSIEKNEVHMDTISFVSDENSISMQGDVSIYSDSINAVLHSFGLKYENYLLQNKVPILVKVVKDTLQIKDFELEASNYGSIKLEGMWIFSKAFSNIKLQIINTRLEPFNQFLNWKYQLKGVLTADIDFEGNVFNPTLACSLNVHDVFFGDYRIGSLNSKIDYRNQNLTIDRIHYEYQDSSYVNLNGNIRLSDQDSLFKDLFSANNAVDMSLDISNLQIQNYAFFIKPTFPLYGMLSGHVKFSGTMSAPLGSLSIEGANTAIDQYQFSHYKIEGRVSPSRILVDKADINFLDTNFLVKGFKTIHWDFNNLDSLFSDKSFGLLCEIEEDSLNFLYAFIPDIDRIIGGINISARFGGNIDNPQLVSGKAEIKNGRLYLTKIENPIQNISFQAHVDDKRLIIDQFQGSSPQVEVKESIFQKLVRRFFAPAKKLLYGTSTTDNITVAGNIDFSKLNRPKYHIDVLLKDAYLNYYLENARLVVNSDNLHISGRDTITVSGRATIKEGNIDLDIEESEKNLLLSKSTRVTPPYLQYFLNVEIPDNFFISSSAPFNTFNVEIGGNVRILQEPMGLLEMYGELNIIKGKYFIQFEDLDIRSGTVNFVNPKEYPELNLTAKKQKNNYLFDLNVSGPLNNPVKEMHTKNLETGEEIYEVKDQMALLLFGVRFQELSGLGHSAFLQKGEEVLTQTIINQFEKEARFFTGLDRIRISTQTQDESNLNVAGTGTDQVSTLALGKYITPNLYFEYQTKLSYVPGLANFPKPSLSWESGNQIYLKYRISRNWSLSSLYEKTLRGNDKVQFDVNWQIDF